MAQTELSENLSDLIFQIGQQKGDEGAVHALLERGADPNARDRFGFRAVQRASQFDRPNLVRALLKAGADPNAAMLPNKRGLIEGNTVLMTAAGRGFADVVNALLAGGADINRRDAHGYNALNGAIYSKHAHIVEQLRNAGIDVGLMEAGWLGDISALQTLLAETGAAKSNAAENALCGAATMGHESAVRLLLYSGVTPNASEAKNRNVSALMRAAQEGHEEIARLLLDAGADINQVQPTGGTALFSAVESMRGRSYTIVELLLKRGANPNPPTRSGWTPLMVVSLWGGADIAELLLERGADPSVFSDEKAASAEGITTANALMFAIGNAHLDVVQVLLRYGANPDAPNNGGKTARDSALCCLTRHCPWEDRKQNPAKIWELLQTAPPMFQKTSADGGTINLTKPCH